MIVSARLRSPLWLTYDTCIQVSAIVDTLSVVCSVSGIELPSSDEVTTVMPALLAKSRIWSAAVSRLVSPP